jgi:hypothetical protein
MGMELLKAFLHEESDDLLKIPEQPLSGHITFKLLQNGRGYHGIHVARDLNVTHFVNVCDSFFNSVDFFGSL